MGFALTQGSYQPKKLKERKERPLIVGSNEKIKESKVKLSTYTHL